ncbi:2-phosphosulfolactate phosphatase [Adhaeribacter pallidiroseus]|uniref:Probable 2-phosphosulfolactate phosphatase n=1 Tax=Adhaeribacter pallidiroseus TaxID=2072847 RepID=A0A369QGK6_9BACT|nr:2-phosphosulfolactate phosphatase [Adhaeribacter pallidiroseus]RDC63542.1 2-phosphosulfolactate phosphatase [Adhaeribacter pallidiroseus]
MPLLDVCFTPELIHLYALKGRVVVVVDILRATSTMVTGLAHGLEKIIPVSTLAECQQLAKHGYLTAAERDGKKADGFDLGNSPFSYMEDLVKGKTLAMTTTNGTHAIRLSEAADQVVAGAFLNVSSVAAYLTTQQKDVLVVCAGWKGKFNLEDTLFAGALAHKLQGNFEFENDATLAAAHLYAAAQNDLMEYLSKASHVQRLQNLHIIKDIAFCLQQDVYEVVPVLEGNYLVPYIPETIKNWV